MQHGTLLSVTPAPARPIVLELLARSRTAASVLARWLVRLALWSWPHLKTGARLSGAGGAALGVAAADAGRHALRHRSKIARVLTRAAWWTSLWLWFIAGRALFDLLLPLDGSWLAARILPGFALCAVVLALAPERHMRWAAWVLGLGHGALGLLALTLTGA